MALLVLCNSDSIHSGKRCFFHCTDVLYTNIYFLNAEKQYLRKKKLILSLILKNVVQVLLLDVRNDLGPQPQSELVRWKLVVSEALESALEVQ